MRKKGIVFLTILTICGAVLLDEGASALAMTCNGQGIPPPQGGVLSVGLSGGDGRLVVSGSVLVLEDLGMGTVTPCVYRTQGGPVAATPANTSWFDVTGNRVLTVSGSGGDLSERPDARMTVAAGAVVIAGTPGSDAIEFVCTRKLCRPNDPPHFNARYVQFNNLQILVPQENQCCASVDGGAGDDRLIAHPHWRGPINLFGGDGKDTLEVRAGNFPPNVALDGGAGDDVLRAGNGSDHLTGGAGNDTLEGRNGNDTFDEGGPGANGADLILGGGGVDDVLYSGREGDVSVSLDGVANDGEAGEGDNVGADSPGVDGPSVSNLGVENVTGGNGSDNIVGDDSKNVLVGGGGQDHLVGLGGVDTLEGEEGQDVLEGGSQSDSLNGGGGDDQLVGDSGDDFLLGGLGGDTMSGGGGSDSFDAKDGFSDSLDGGQGVDRASIDGGLDVTRSIEIIM